MFVKTIADKGIQFEEFANDKSWLWKEAHLKDPDENHIILYYAGDNRLNELWRLKKRPAIYN